MPTNIMTNTYTTPMTLTLLMLGLASIASIFPAIFFWAEFRRNRSVKTTFIAILFSIIVLLLVVSILNSVAESRRQHVAMKTTTFKVASVSRNATDGNGVFVYRVEDNKFGVKTITASVNNASIATRTMADESKVKTITIRYGKINSLAASQKNLYEIVERTY